MIAGHQHLATPEAIGQSARDDCEHTPCEAERADEIAEVLIVEVQVLHHRREQRRDDPAVQADEAEAEREQDHDLQLVALVVGFGHRPLLESIGFF